MRALAQTRYCILNGHTIYTLEQEREKLRACVLSRDAEGSDITRVLCHFSKAARKVDQAYRLKAKLNKETI